MTVRAIVLAAGKGTRMKSAQPKVLHELCGRPMLWYTLRALRQAGVDDIVVVTNAELQARISEFGAGVTGVMQEPQLGTGHAAQIALASMKDGKGRVVIAYGDMPLVGADILRAVLAALDSNAVAMVTARMPLPSNFGRVIRKGEFVDRIVEERDASADERLIDEMNAGIYAYGESELRSAVAGLRNDNAQGEYYLTDTVGVLSSEGKRVVPVVARDHKDVLGINDRIELARAHAEMNARLCRTYMAQGVTIVDPLTTYLEPELEIGRDTVIYPNTAISRLSVIGTECVIGPNARLSNAHVGNNATVRESVIVDSSLGGDVTVGPFAHIRGHAKLESGVRVGNFVEVKNSVLHDGVKAGHLSYLGDCEIGTETNIGAGTITCNYDGTRKNKTTIGKKASIGSNTSIVAPRTIGDGALTGAGSVITKDVAAGGRVAGNPAKPIGKKT
ncbi:MAG: bifunctional UDP-N-acetylglucosamine diphosphorylase/glucosamine-1-phosphate N-acetyltransferase GlmU [Candidatus Eremiobacteraeota bacterium]|nr:bifunctional UDP-N-acetylglucosamine diphosphorylase/glucosamine-1-phosphate N-acetyltransferase GlmU [Candidatus Eremiobacteraeota bacterium]